MTKQNPKVGTKSALSVVQIIFGSVFICACGNIFFAAIIKSCFGLITDEPWGALVGLLLGIMLIKKGIAGFSHISVYKKIICLPNTQNGQTVEELSSAINLSKKKLLKSLQYLINNKFWVRNDIEETSITLIDQYSGSIIILADDGKIFKELKEKPVTPLLISVIFPIIIIAMIPFCFWYEICAVAIAGITIVVLSNIIFSKKQIIIKIKKSKNRVNSRGHVQHEPVVQRTDNTEEKIMIYNDETLEAARIEMLKVENSKVALSENTEIQEIVAITHSILEHLSKNPEKIRQSRHFLLYYLPGAVKLLISYEKMMLQEYRGHNINESITKIENKIPSIKRAFCQELDNLYQDEALNIAAEVSVLEYMSENITIEDSSKTQFNQA